MQGKLHRRHFATWAVGTLPCVSARAQSPAAPPLKVLAWAGYADADVVAEFEELTRSRVEITTVATDDQLRAHVDSQGNGGFDVIAANTAEIARYAAGSRLARIELNRVPQSARQLSRFRDHASIPGLMRQGALHALPYTFAEMGLIYDRRQLSRPPTSITALWDSQLRGKVLAYDGSSHNFTLAAQALDLPPFRIPSNHMPRVARHLVDLRRNVRGFYTQPEESVELFRRHRIALMFANYGVQQVKLLRDAGADVGYVLPREGALAWLDCWAITAACTRTDLAHTWLDHMLSASVGRRLTQRQGLANTVEPLPTAVAEGRVVWLEPVEDEVRRAALWRRIMSGERPERLR
jgi:putative spermidine/putrescine transport system substrate-binding protein